MEAESKLQKFVESYEVAELEATLLEQADEAIGVLLACNDELEKLRQGVVMTTKRKQTFLKFSWKLSAINRILSHSLVSNRIRLHEPLKLLQEIETDFVECLASQLVGCISQGATLRET